MRYKRNTDNEHLTRDDVNYLLKLVADFSYYMLRSTRNNMYKPYYHPVHDTLDNLNAAKREIESAIKHFESKIKD